MKAKWNKNSTKRTSSSEKWFPLWSIENLTPRKPYESTNFEINIVILVNLFKILIIISSTLWLFLGAAAMEERSMNHEKNIIHISENWDINSNVWFILILIMRRAILGATNPSKCCSKGEWLEVTIKKRDAVHPLPIYEK